MLYEAPKAQAPTLSETDRRDLTSLLSPTPVEQDELIRLSGLSAQVVIAILLELDLAGRLFRDTGQRIALIEQSDEEDS